LISGISAGDCLAIQEIHKMTTIILEVALAINQKPESWQGSADMDSFYVLIASLLSAFVAFIILMRLRW
jgi:hypothetical protein